MPSPREGTGAPLPALGVLARRERAIKALSAYAAFAEVGESAVCFLEESFNIKGVPVVIQKLFGTFQRGQGPSSDSDVCRTCFQHSLHSSRPHTHLVPSERSPALGAARGCHMLAAQCGSENTEAQATSGLTFLWRLATGQGARCLQGRAGGPVQGHSSVLGL